ncbi:MAG: Na/Pi symporter [Gammaproteobacteria bacterium]|nr:Na/Pi symporter [Gammaproteobacteria bacterium]
MTDSPSPLPLLLSLAASVCLLLWGSHVLRTTLETTFSASLHALIHRAAASMPKSIAGGAVVAVLMQSATATILLAAGMSGSGSLSLASAMGIVLGADLGSALATRILFIDLSLLPPAVLVAGFVLHRGSHSHRNRRLGRALLGLGLILLAIQLMRAALAPVADSPASDEWLAVLRSVHLLSAAAFAALAYLAHSSVATVLIIASLAQGAMLPADLFVAMVLGANVGAGFIALPLVGVDNPEARSVVIANLIARASLAVLLFITAAYWVHHVPPVAAGPGVRAVWFHILFNLILVAVFAPWAGRLAGAVKRYLEAKNRNLGGALRPSIGAGLDAALLSSPRGAVTCARREACRLGDSTETFFSRSLEMFHAKDQSQIDFMIASDREINERNKAILHYLTDARAHIADPEDERELDRVLQFSSTMENVGDTISYNLSRLASKRLDRSAMFSTEGMDEITRIHEAVLELLKSVNTRFMTADAGGHKHIRKRVRQIQTMCGDSLSRHRRRLSDKNADSLGSSSIHQDTIRDLLHIALLLETATDAGGY